MSAAAGRFAPGDRVRVRCDWPEAGPRRVHVRTPHYLRGCTGVVELCLDAYPNPEELAFGKAGMPAKPLYQVRFEHGALWPHARTTRDSVVADIYEHWLEPAEESRHG